MSKESTVKLAPNFSCDDIPFPVIIHACKDGEILQFNKSAAKLFGINSKKKTKGKIGSIYKCIEKKTKTGKTDLEPIFFRKGIGQPVPLRVSRKKLVFQGEKYHADFFEEFTENYLVAKTLNDSSPDAIVALSSKGLVVDWNTSAEKIFGWIKNEAIGKSLAQLVIIEPFRKRFTLIVKEHLTKDKPFVSNGFVELGAHNKNGVEFPVEVTIKVINENGKLNIYAFLRDISERKKFQEEVKRSEYNLKRAQSIASVGSWEMSGKCSEEIYWSDEFYRIHGLIPQSVIPSSQLRLSMVHPEDRVKLQEAIKVALKKGKPFSFEKRIVRSDGEVRWVLSQGETSIDSVSGERTIFGTVLDINTHKVRERQLQRTRFTIEQSSDAIFWIRPDATFADFNKQAYQSLGYSFEEMKQLSVPDIDVYYSNEVWPQHWEDLRRQKAITFESLQKRKDGTVINVEITANYIDFDGEEFNCAFVKDISRRRNAETELAKSEAKLRSFFQSTSDSIILISTNYEIFDFNPIAYHRTKKYLGLELDKLDNALAIPTKEMLEFFKENLDEALAGNEKTHEIESRFVSRTSLWWRITFTPIRNSEGKIIGAAHIATNIDKEKRATQRLLNLTDSIPDGLIFEFVSNFDGTSPRFTYLSLGAERMFEIPAKKLMEDIRTGTSLVHPDDRKMLFRTVSESIVSRATLSIDFRIITPSGKLKWLRIRANPNISHPGHIVLEGINLDVTHEREFEQKLETLEAKLLSFFQSSEDAIILLNRELMITEFNRKASQFAIDHYEKELIRGVSLLDYLFDAARQGVINAVNRAWDGETISREIEVRFPTDKTMWIKAQYVPVRTEQGQIIAVSFVVMDIDVEKRSRERLVNLANNIPDGLIYEYQTSADDSDHKFTYASQGVENIFELSVDELMADAMSLFNLVCEEDLPLLKEVSRIARENVTDINVDYRIRVKSGKMKWIRTKAKPRKLNDGIIVFDGICIDISHQKELEFEQAANQIKLQATLDNMISGVAVVNAQGEVTYCNESGIQILGIGNEKLAYKYFSLNVGETIDKDGSHIPREQSVIFSVLKQKKPVLNAEYGIKRSDGSIIWLQVNAAPLIDESGELSGVVASFTDVTSRKEQQQILEDSESRFRLLTQELPVGVLLQGIKDEILLNNIAATTLLGISQDQLLGKSSFDPDWQVIHEDGSPFLPNDRPSVLASALKRAVENVPMGVYRPANKDWVWLMTSATPLFNSKGDVRQVIVTLVDVTIERERKKELEKLSLIAKHTNNLIVITGPDRRIQWVNHAFENLTGYLLADAVGHKPGDLLQGEETSSDTIAFVQEKLRRNEPVKFEILNYDKNRKKYWVEVDVQPLFNEQGVLDYYIAIQADITERKLSEEALKHSEANLQTIFNNTDTGFVLYDEKMNIQSFNSIAYNYTIEVHDRAIFIGSNFLSYFSEDRKSDLLRLSKRVLAGQLIEYDREVKTIGGDKKWFHIKYAPVKGSEKIDGIVMSISEITLKKNSERALLESELRQRVIADSLPSVAIYQFKVDSGQPDGYYTYYSSGLEAITGLRPEELINDPDLFEKRIHPDDKTIKDEKINEANRNHLGFEHEFRIQHKNGKWVWLRNRSNPTFLDEGSIVWNGLIIDITEQKRSDDLIKESEERFRLATEAAHMGVWEWNINNNCVTWDDVTKDIFQDDSQSDASRLLYFIDRIHPDDKNSVEAAIKQSIQQSTPCKLNFCWIRPDRSEIDIEAVGIIKLDSSGKPLTLTGLIANITEKRKAEKALEASELRLRTILEMEPECVKILNRKGELIEMNAAGLKMIEADNLNQVKGQAMLSLIHQSHKAEFSQLTREIFKGNSGQLTFQMVGLKGTSRWMETNAVPMKDAFGEVTALLGVTRDITERKTSEDKNKESEGRFRSLADTAPVIIWMTDAAKQFNYFNKIYWDFIGMTATEENRSDWQRNIHPEDLSEVEMVFNRAFKQKRSYRLEYRLKRNDGSYRWILGNGNPRYLSDGTFLGYIGTGVDITGQKRRRQQLEAITKLQGDFIVESDAVTFFNSALKQILSLTESGYGLIHEVLFDNGRPYLNIMSVANISSYETDKLFYERDLVFERLDKILDNVLATGKVILTKEPNLEENTSDFSQGEVYLNACAGIPLYKGIELIGILAIANRPGGYSEKLIKVFSPIIETISGLLDAHRNQRSMKKIEEELKNAKNRLELATQGLGIWDVDLTTGKVIWDEGMRQLYGIQSEQTIVTQEEWQELIHPEDLAGLLQSNHLPMLNRRDLIMQDDAKNYKIDFRIIRNDNNEVRYIETLGIIERNHRGQVLRMTGVNIDRTKERIYEQRLLNSVKEKEMLIKEIHHRVKNNLQLISSIIYIKMKAVEQSELSGFLEDTRSKIHSIALIHERLLQTGDVNQIDLSDYLGRLVMDLNMTHFRPEVEIDIICNIQPDIQGSDTAIYCGLIINELVTNALKHAYSNAKKGTIYVSLEKKEDKCYLTVKDDGTPLPVGIEPGKSGTFGMQLLDIFIKQLKGTYGIDRNGGTAFLIRF